MKRQIPGLQRESGNGDEIMEGIFLVRVDRAFYRWHPQRPFFVLRFVILEPLQYRCPATDAAGASLSPNRKRQNTTDAEASGSSSRNPGQVNYWNAEPLNRFHNRLLCLTIAAGAGHSS
jgi:hypothetical protein